MIDNLASFYRNGWLELGQIILLIVIPTWLIATGLSGSRQLYRRIFGTGDNSGIVIGLIFLCFLPAFLMQPLEKLAINSFVPIDYVVIPKNWTWTLSTEEREQIKTLRKTAKEGWRDCFAVAVHRLGHDGPLTEQQKQMNKAYEDGTLPKQHRLFIEEMVEENTGGPVATFGEFNWDD